MYGNTLSYIDESSTERVRSRSQAPTLTESVRDSEARIADLEDGIMALYQLLNKTVKRLTTLEARVDRMEIHQRTQQMLVYP